MTDEEKCELLGIIQGKDKVIQELKKENANLKALRKYELNVAKLEIEKLEQENAGLKARLSVINLLTPELEKVSKLRKQQLTKAKEIIKDYMTIVKGIHSTVCGVPEEKRTINVLQLNEEAEQFLNSEVEE